MERDLEAWRLKKLQQKKNQQPTYSMLMLL